MSNHACVFQLRPLFKAMLPPLNAFLRYPNGTVCYYQLELLRILVQYRIIDDIGPRLRVLCEQIQSHPQPFLCESCDCGKIGGSRDERLALLSAAAGAVLGGAVSSARMEKYRLDTRQSQNELRDSTKQCCNAGCSKKGSDACVELMRCACDTELYCSVECQRQDWRARHKKVCANKRKTNKRGK